MAERTAVMATNSVGRKVGLSADSTDSHLAARSVVKMVGSMAATKDSKAYYLVAMMAS